MNYFAVVSEELLILVDEQRPLDGFAVLIEPPMLEAVLGAGSLARVGLKHPEKELFTLWRGFEIDVLLYNHSRVVVLVSRKNFTCIMTLEEVGVENQIE